MNTDKANLAGRAQRHPTVGSHKKQKNNVCHSTSNTPTRIVLKYPGETDAYILDRFPLPDDAALFRPCMIRFIGFTVDIRGRLFRPEASILDSLYVDQPPALFRPCCGVSEAIEPVYTRSARRTCCRVGEPNEYYNVGG